MNAGIKVETISKSFTSADGRQVQAISNLSFECQRGDFLCVLGPTGCGKTTLLRLLAGLERPDDGTVSVNNAPLQDINCQAGLIFQQNSLFPWLRVIDNIAFALRMKGVERKRRYAESRLWLKRVGLDGFESAFPYELSGGMVQRVALCRALIAEPEILLMDEPFSALDERTRHGLQGALIDLWKQTGCTIVFVTHNIDEAVCLAQRVIVMGSPPQSFGREIVIQEPHPRDRLSSSFEKHLLKIRKVFETLVG